jgi:predicted nucleotidyltransferase component of viral defense system
MQTEWLKPFSLVGGTALALRYGHRQSVDLDLFSHQSFDVDTMHHALKREFGKSFEMESRSEKVGLFCFVENIKVDIIYYPHPLIGQLLVIDQVRMYSDADIIAMKFNAILGRGKKKDFWDIHELLKHHSLGDMIAYHEAKYADQNLLITIPQALVYFDDTEDSEEPVSLKGQTWSSVKEHIRTSVSQYLK